MQSFNDWRNLNENYSQNYTTSYSINELIEKIDGMTPNFSEIIVYKILPEELNSKVLEARKHYDEAVKILKSIAYQKDAEGNYLGDKEFGKAE